MVTLEFKNIKKQVYKEEAQHTLSTTNGWVNCTEVIDANGKFYIDKIPAIRLWA